MKENTLQKECLNILKKNHIYCINMYGSSRTGKGTPDILACIKGKFFAFELKVENNDTSDIQKYRLKKIRESGGHGYVIRSVNELNDILKREGVYENV